MTFTANDFHILHFAAPPNFNTGYYCYCPLVVIVSLTLYLSDNLLKFNSHLYYQYPASNNIQAQKIAWATFPERIRFKQKKRETPYGTRVNLVTSSSSQQSLIFHRSLEHGRQWVFND
jgi:hypothetical protein